MSGQHKQKVIKCETLVADRISASNLPSSSLGSGVFTVTGASDATAFPINTPYFASRAFIPDGGFYILSQLIISATPGATGAKSVQFDIDQGMLDSATTVIAQAGNTNTSAVSITKTAGANRVVVGYSAAALTPVAINIIITGTAF